MLPALVAPPSYLSLEVRLFLFDHCVLLLKDLLSLWKNYLVPLSLPKSLSDLSSDLFSLQKNNNNFYVWLIPSFWKKPSSSFLKPLFLSLIPIWLSLLKKNFYAWLLLSPFLNFLSVKKKYISNPKSLKE